SSRLSRSGKGRRAMIDSRALLVYLLQPVLSFLFAAALTTLALWIMRTRCPGLRATILLLPVVKILLDLWCLSPQSWIGSTLIDAATLPSGTRMGTLSIAAGGSWMVPRASIDLSYVPSGSEADAPA